MSFDPFLSFVVVGATLAAIGVAFSQLVFDGKPRAGLRGWRGVWYVTLPFHAIVVGAALGHFATTLPTPTWMGSGAAGRVMWYALSGALGTVCYDTVKGLIKQRAAGAGAPPDA